MAEYIEKEALLNAICIDRCERNYRGICTCCDEAALVKHFPTADAEPVKHGRWVMTLYTTTSKRGRVISNKKFACSECGYHNGRKRNNYCPNCGAKMDLEES